MVITVTSISIGMPDAGQKLVAGRQPGSLAGKMDAECFDPATDAWHIASGPYVLEAGTSAAGLPLKTEFAFSGPPQGSRMRDGR